MRPFVRIGFTLCRPIHIYSVICKIMLRFTYRRAAENIILTKEREVSGTCQFLGQSATAGLL